MQIYRELSSLTPYQRRKLLKSLKDGATWDSARFEPIDGHPVSLDPPPDVFLCREYRDPFLEAVSDVCSSAVWQLQGRGGYNESAQVNRERIARDAAIMAQEMAVLRKAVA